MKKIIPVLIIAAVLRLAWLGTYPAGFTADEAGQGYDAYSILKTGRDSWGQFLPLFPRGFGDFKPPLYMYLTVPSIAALGLNEVAVRLPTALAGTVSVAVVFLLTREIFKKSNIEEIAAFMLAISPWHIQLSRIAWEGGLGVLLFPLGLWLYLKNRFWLAFSIWGLLLYTYHSWRLFIVLFVMALFIWRRRFHFSVSIFFIALLPIIFNSSAALKRASDVGIFSPEKIAGYFKTKGASPLSYTLARALDNKYLFLADQFVSNYLSYFNPMFYFTGRRPDSTHLNFPGTSLHFPLEIIFILSAIYYLLKNRPANSGLLLLWAVLAPIPAALTESSHAQRGITVFPLTILLSAYGLVQLKKFIIPTSLAIAISFILFLNTYLIKLPQRPIYSQRVEYKEIFTTALSLANRFDSVHFSKVFSVPHIFVAFYGRWDPADFQKYSSDWLRYEKSDKLYVDQLESYNLGKFEFHDLDWQRERSRPDALLVSSAKDFPPDMASLTDISGYRLVPVNVQ